MDNPKVEIKKSVYGKGIFAKQLIKKGEVIAVFDGKIYGWYSKFWNSDLYNHCIQFEEKKWRDSKGIARLINHSCNPNCGISNFFEVVAMKAIKPGQQITWDYEMTEDHPWWRMQCMCGEKNCRKTIGSFQNMPESVRKKHAGYISKWLVQKYHLN